MTGGIAGFGGSGYSSPQQRALTSIANTPNPDVSSQDKLVELLQHHSSQIKYLASNQKQLQQGVNDATANPIQQIEKFIADIIVLLGGGQLAAGALDFGDLQYILPALGALLGLGDGPFPVNLFEAAEKFFLGYVVPGAQFTDTINNIIQAWLTVIGIDPTFIHDIRALISAFGELFDGLQNILPSLDQLFGSLGIDANDLGPLGQVLKPIIDLFSGIDLTDFGDAIEFITHAIDPFIVQITAIINWVDSILAVLGYHGGTVVNSPLGDTTLPFGNLLSFLGDISFGSPDFNIIDAAIKFWQLILNPTGLIVGATDVIGAIMGDTLVMPFTMGGNTGPVPQWFVDIPQAIEDIITNFLNAFARLDPTGITGRFADFMQQIFDLADGIFTRSKTHSANLAVLNSRVLGDTDANAITFTFTGASATLDTLGWTMINAGATGMDFTQHDDYVQMTSSAPADATLIAIYDTGNTEPAKHFTSHIQSCTYYPREQIASSGQTALEMPLRTNNATTLSTLRCCYARVARGGAGGIVDFVILIDGVATDLADIPGVDPDLVSVSGLKFAATDQFDFVLGDPDADPILQADQYNWRWRWYLNTNLILDTVYNPVPWNAAAADLLDETVYNCLAFGMTADFIFIFLPSMVPPTTLDQLSYYTPAVAA